MRANRRRDRLRAMSMAQRDARICHVLIRWVAEKPTLKRYKVYPSLETIACETGWSSGLVFSQVCRRRLGAPPKTIWQRCKDAGSTEPVFKALEERPCRSVSTR